MLCLLLGTAGLPAQSGQVDHSTAAGSSPSGAVCAPTNSPIAWSDLGAKATAQYSGVGLSVAVTPQGGVRLRCAFQKLEGEVTAEGLWLESTVPGRANASGAATVPARRFRVMAEAVGREGGTMTALPRSGTASGDSSSARFARPGVVEEYSVSVDGVRQDFVVSQPPDGPGDLCVELALDGARAESSAAGAQLVLEGSGRKLAYSRLRVVDATGRELAARMAVIPVGDEVTSLKLRGESSTRAGEQSLLTSSPTSGTRLVVVVADANAVYPVRIDPTFSDEDWSALGSGMDNIVQAMAVSGTNLYASGIFTTAGGAPANRIASWNGTAWSALGAGMNQYVAALAVSGTNLYAGGAFSTADGKAANRIAKWDGTAWSALGAGMNEYVYALAVSGTNLYAGGIFTTAGGKAANRIAKWDGIAWSALGTGMDKEVSTLAVSGTNLYAGGIFTTADGAPANRIAKWDGTAWSALGAGVNNDVSVLAVSDTNLYVGGSFTYATNGASTAVSANRIAKWDGTAWSALGSGMDNIVAALAVTNTSLYAGGLFTTAGGKSAVRVAKAALGLAVPTTTLASSANPSIVGASVTFTATVAPGAATGTVTFLDGANPLGTGTLSSGAATFTTSGLSGGSHSLTAAYGGDGNYSASASSPLIQMVARMPFQNGPWNDPATWGGTLPAAGDDVVIPAGITVTVGAGPLVVRNLTVIGTLTVAGAQTIQISGNFTNNGTFTPGTGTVELTGDANQTLAATAPGALNFYKLTENKTSTTNTVTCVSHLAVSKKLTLTKGKLISASDYGDVFIEIAGTLVLTSDITVSGNFTNHGTLTTAGYGITFDGGVEQNLSLANLTTFDNLTVTAGTTLIETETSDSVLVQGTLLNQGVIRKTQPVTSVDSYYFGLAGNYGAGLEIDVTSLAGVNPLTAIQVDRVDSNPPNAPGTNVTGIYWIITPTGNDFLATLILPQDDLADPQVCRYQNSRWDWTRSGFDPAAATVTRTNVTAFGEFAVFNHPQPIAAAVEISNLSQTYDGTAKSVTVTTVPTNLAVSVTYDGSASAPINAGNYSVVAIVTDPYYQGTNTATAQITPKALTVSGITAASTIYDGTTTAKLGGTAQFPAPEAPGTGSTSDGKPYTVDAVAAGGTPAGTLALKNVGPQAVTITGVTVAGTGNGNYTATQQAGLTQAITPKALTVSGITAASTVYDGTLTAKLGGTAAFQVAEAAAVGTGGDGKPYTGNGDAVSISGTAAGTLAAKDVGPQAVTITGVTVTGTGAGNYTVTQPTGLTQAVTAKALSVTAPSIASKGYDATATAGAVTVGAVSGFVGSEYVSATGAAANYSSASVGTYPGVVITYTLHDGTGGGVAANYSLANGTATGQITLRALTVAGIQASDKVYDGTTKATLILTDTALVGNLDGTNVVLSTTNATGAFADPNVGINKPVWVSGLTLSGSATNNYAFSQPTTNATITGKPLNITANADAKTYGEVKLYGPNRLEFGTDAGELVNGDDVTSVTLACADGEPATAAVGSYAIIPSAAVGIGLENYLINYQAGALTVGARGLNVTADADAKTYGTAKPYGPGQTAFSTGAGELVNGDRVSSVTLGSSDGGPATAVVGSYHLSVSAAAGTGLGNYAIHYHDGTLTVNPKALNITANGDSKTYGAVKVYGPGQTAFGTGAGELVNGDSVTNVTLACLDGGPATAAVGSYDIIASAAVGSGLGNYSLSYHAGTLRVLAANSALTLVSSANPSVHGSNVIFTATVTPVAPATTTPGGSVQFYLNGDVCGSPVPLSGGAAGIVAAFYKLGTNLVAATYLPDGNYAGSEASLVQLVQATPQAPNTTGIKNNGNGTVTVSFSGTPNAGYVVQASDRLVAPLWQNVSTNVAGADGRWTFEDAIGRDLQRFYRAVRP